MHLIMSGRSRREMRNFYLNAKAQRCKGTQSKIIAEKSVISFLFIKQSSLCETLHLCAFAFMAFLLGRAFKFKVAHSSIHWKSVGMKFPKFGTYAVVSLSVMTLTSACSKKTTPVVIDDSLRVVSVQPDPESLACATCHQAIFDEWVGSQHANANRLVTDAHERAAFDPSTTMTNGSFITTMQRTGRDAFEFVSVFSNQPPETFRAEAVIGIIPLRQYLVSYPDGRLQVMDMSYDPRSNEWFNAFGDENRQPHEWGHWKGRSMTWNVQCAFCHMSGFEKKYDLKEDRYNSTWKAMGISCTQCHALKSQHLEQVSGKTNECPMVSPLRPVTSNQQPATSNQYPEHRIQHMDNCASCHARREELFGTFKPGDSFHDHFRLTLPDQPGIYRADGQVLDEDFEYGSFMMSRMGHKGVTCMDCHNPHSGKLVAPVENNALCMQCHTYPGLKGATPVDPVKHSFHKPGVPGSLCVDCHMPKNVYMQRDARRDHGFTSPDPRLTIEHGIPNACNGCHTDQTPEWADNFTTQWYGDKMNRRARDRARVVARFYEGDLSIVTQLLAMAQSEEIDAWRAALTGMLAGWTDEEPVQTFLRGELKHASPLVRSAAIRSLGEAPASALSDTNALVRVDAAMARYEATRQIPAPSYRELIDYINNISDQPAGALRQAHIAGIEQRPDDVEAWARKARDWDPSSPLTHYLLGRAQHNRGKIAEASSNLYIAATMASDNAEYSYALALLIAETGNNDLAQQWLEETVRRNPDFGRAWFNLGLAYSKANLTKEAILALRKAEQLMPESPEPSYARATIHARMGERGKAIEAANCALHISPAYEPALNLNQQLR